MAVTFFSPQVDHVEVAEKKPLLMVGFNWPLIPLLTKSAKMAKPIHPMLQHTITSSTMINNRLVSRSLLLHALALKMVAVEQSACKRKAEYDLQMGAKRRRLEQPLVSSVVHLVSPTFTSNLPTMSSLLLHKAPTTAINPAVSNII